MGLSLIPARTRAGAVRSYPPLAGLSPLDRPPARPEDFDELHARPRMAERSTSPRIALLLSADADLVSVVSGHHGTYKRAGEHQNAPDTLRCRILNAPAKRPLSGSPVALRAAGARTTPPIAGRAPVIMCARSWPRRRVPSTSPGCLLLQAHVRRQL